MKVLILAYDFPPLISIGALRPYSWYKYLPDFDIETTVVSRYWYPGPNTWQEQILATADMQVDIQQQGPRKLIRVPFIPGLKDKLLIKLQADKYRRLRQIITYLYSYLEYTGMGMDSRSNIYYEAKKEMSGVHYDYIIATGRPFILFKYASRLAAEFNVPWIADYRDSWTLNHIQGHYIMTPVAAMLNSFYAWREKKFLRNIKWLTTAAPSYIDVMPPAVPPQKIKVIYNGYDDEVVSLLGAPQPAGTRFTIAYAGTIYAMQRLELFLDGLKLFISQSGLTPDNFEVHFWGLKEDEAAVTRIENYNAALKPFIVIHEKVAYAQAMNKLSQAHILLLLASGSNDWLNAKLFDYLALRRRILMVGNKSNVMAAMIDENKAGVSLDNAQAISDYLLSAHKSFATGENMVISPLNYQQFSRRSQAYIFSQLLKNKQE